MKTRMDVLRWAQRVVALKNAPPSQVLEIDPEANSEQLQTRFHDIARAAHPDLHRTSLSKEEHETVTTAYARVTAAYQLLRARRSTCPPESIAASVASARPGLEPPAAPAAPARARPAGSGSMNGKALVYYRKAEVSLRRGDLKGAVLQLKLAIAADPQSSFLRTALAEVEVEVRKIS